MMRTAPALALLLAAAACGGGDDTEAPAGVEREAPAQIPDPAPTERPPEPAATPEEDAAETPEVAPGTPVPESASNQSAGIVQPVTADGYMELLWEDLMPEGEEERLAAMYQEQMQMLYSDGPIVEGSPQDVAVQFGTFNAVEALDGEKIRLPGYTVPFDFSADAMIEEFLLVPYMGACIHVPPPPPNQTILVRATEPVKARDLAQAVWVKGTLNIEIAETELADAAYVITLDELTDYEY
jgi:uncharacterized protein